MEEQKKQEGSGVCFIWITDYLTLVFYHHTISEAGQLMGSSALFYY